MPETNDPTPAPGTPDCPEAAPGRLALAPLKLIGAYKFFKAALMVLIGLGALHLAHRDLAATAAHAIHRLGLDPEGALAHALRQRAGRINPHHLYWVAAGAFAFMTLYVVEGVGLLLDKRWAEWLTAVAGVILVPPEVYEIARRLTAVRVLVLAGNLAIIAYLVWRLRRKNCAGAKDSATIQQSGSGAL